MSDGRYGWHHASSSERLMEVILEYRQSRSRFEWSDERLLRLDWSMWWLASMALAEGSVALNLTEFAQAVRGLPLGRADRRGPAPWPEGPFFHGGVPGLEVGDLLLPGFPKPSMPHWQASPRVVVTTIRKAAREFAATYYPRPFEPGGDLYEVDPGPVVAPVRDCDARHRWACKGGARRPRARARSASAGGTPEAGLSDRLLTAAELADRLAVPVSWVRESTRSGAIPHVQLGRYRRYREADVAKWLEECSKPGRPVALRGCRR